MDRTTTTDIEQLEHLSAEYLKTNAALWEHGERVAAALREDINTGRLSVRQADILLATIIYNGDDGNENEDEDEDKPKATDSDENGLEKDAEWAFDRWELSRRFVDSEAAANPPEWGGLNGLADRLVEHHAELEDG